MNYAGEREALIEDIRWMLKTGENPIGISRRLGKSLGALDKLTTRWAPDINLEFSREYRKEREQKARLREGSSNEE